MQRKRGRPPVYNDVAQHPVLMAVRIPRVLEARLRREATEQQRTMTDVILKALAFQWEHAPAVEELALARQQLSELRGQYKALEGRHTRLRADFTRVQGERDTAQGEVRRVQRERDEVREELGMYKDSLVRRVFGDLLEPGEGLPDDVRRELLKICHPDKWSQGQPAAELAHELTVRLTKKNGQ